VTARSLPTRSRPLRRAARPGATHAREPTAARRRVGHEAAPKHALPELKARALSIVDVIRDHLDRGELSVQLFTRGTAWLDTGIHGSLHQAASFIEAVLNRQGLVGARRHGPVPRCDRPRPGELRDSLGHVAAIVGERASRSNNTAIGASTMAFPSFTKSGEEPRTMAGRARSRAW